MRRPSRASAGLSPVRSAVKRDGRVEGEEAVDTFALCNYCVVTRNRGADRTAGRPGEAAVADEFATAVLTASRVLVGVSARSLAGVEDRLTLSQFRTLVVLEGRAPTLSELADRLGVTASTAMRTVDRLAEADLVVRGENPRDRREVRLELTPEGARVVREVTALRRAEVARIVARMPTAQRAHLLAALQSFAVAAEEPVPDAGDW